jgi:hypothetical protein
VLATSCHDEIDTSSPTESQEQPITFGDGSNFNMEQVYAWAQAEPDDVKAGNLFLKANLSRTTASITTEYRYKIKTTDTTLVKRSFSGSGNLVSSDKITTAAHAGQLLDYIINYKLLGLISGHPHEQNFAAMSDHSVDVVEYADEGAGIGTFIKFDQGRFSFDSNKKLSAHDPDWFNFVKWKQLGLEPVIYSDSGSRIFFDRAVAIWPVQDTGSLSFEHWSASSRDVSTIKFERPKALDDECKGMFSTIKNFRFFPGVFFSSVLAYNAPEVVGGGGDTTPRLGAPSRGNDVFVLSNNYRNTKGNPPMYSDSLLINRSISTPLEENLIHLVAKNISDIIDKPWDTLMPVIPERESDTMIVNGVSVPYITNIKMTYNYAIDTTVDALPGSSGGGYFTYKDVIGKYWNFFEFQGVLHGCIGKKCATPGGASFTDPKVGEDGKDPVDGSQHRVIIAAFSKAIVNRIYETVGNNGLPYLGVPAYDECAKKAASDVERARCEAQLDCTPADSERPEKCLFRTGLDKIQRGETTISPMGGSAGTPTATTSFTPVSQKELDDYLKANKLRSLECFGKRYPGLGEGRAANLNVGIVGGISKDGKGVGTLGVICSPRSYTEWTMNWDFLRVVMLHKVDGNLRGKADLEQNIFESGGGGTWDGFLRLLFADFYNSSWSKIPKDPEVPVTSDKDLMFATPATQFCPPGFIMKGISYAHARPSGKDYVAAITKIHCIDMMRGQDKSEDKCVDGSGVPRNEYPCTISLWADKSLNPIPSGHPHYGRTLSQPIGMPFNNPEILIEVSRTCPMGTHLTGLMVPDERSGRVKTIESICRPY